MDAETFQQPPLPLSLRLLSMRRNSRGTPCNGRNGRLRPAGLDLRLSSGCKPPAAPAEIKKIIIVFNCARGRGTVGERGEGESGGKTKRTPELSWTYAGRQKPAALNLFPNVPGITRCWLSHQSPYTGTCNLHLQHRPPESSQQRPPLPNTLTDRRRTVMI